jgi:flavin-dependent dehydrogenase
MGEGIGPAIRSGMRAAEAIADECEYTLEGIDRYSEKLGRFLALGLR